jgi:hypothetical protein
MADDAHDGGPCRPQAQPLSQRVLVRPVLLREMVINDRHGLAAGPITSREEAAGTERNAERGEVIRRNKAEFSVVNGTGIATAAETARGRWERRSMSAI